MSYYNTSFQKAQNIERIFTTVIIFSNIYKIFEKHLLNKLNHANINISI